MVGIPGKSKGCNTCRRRKKGCDLKRPNCGQCLKSRLDCGGYERDTIWINMTQETGVASRYTGRKTPAVALAEPFARSACHELYLRIFWSSYLPNGREFPPEASRYSGGVWMNELHVLFRGGSHEALKKILLALSLTHLGRRDNEPWMIESGINLYGGSLAALARKLEKEGGPIDDISLATSRLLSLYEILFGHDLQDRLGQATNWQVHQRGELGLLGSRGPESFRTGFAHQLFVDGRSTLISASIGSGSGSVLNEPGWKSIPWGNRPKTPKDLLGDIFAEIPAIVGETNSLRSASDGSTKAVRKIKLLEKLALLEKNWLNWGVKSAPTISLTVSDTAQPTQVFEKLTAAQIMAGYWSIGIILYATLHLMSSTWSSTTALERTDPRLWCRKIAATLPIFLHPLSGEFGVHGAIFPSIVALSYLQEADSGFSSPEARTFYGVFSSSDRGKTVQVFVENTLERLSAEEVRLFAPFC